MWCRVSKVVASIGVVAKIGSLLVPGLALRYWRSVAPGADVDALLAVAGREGIDPKLELPQGIGRESSLFRLLCRQRGRAPDGAAWSELGAEHCRALAESNGDLEAYAGSESVSRQCCQWWRRRD